VRGQGVPCVTVDPSTTPVGTTPGQSWPLARATMLVTVVVAPPGQTPTPTDKMMSASALGAAPAPRVHKKKKLAVKKSAL
jgi:hypothetical protein